MESFVSSMKTEQVGRNAYRTRAKAAVHLLPTVERLLRDPHPAYHLRQLRTRPHLLQRKRDLLLGVPRLRHVQLLARRLRRGEKLTLNMDGKAGERQHGQSTGVRFGRVLLT